MQSPNESQFQLFGLALGKYTQYTNNVPDTDLGVCKVNLNGPVARRCGQLLYMSSEDLVHFYYLIIHIVTALHGLAVFGRSTCENLNPNGVPRVAGRNPSVSSARTLSALT